MLAVLCCGAREIVIILGSPFLQTIMDMSGPFHFKVVFQTRDNRSLNLGYAKLPGKLSMNLQCVFFSLAVRYPTYEHSHYRPANGIRNVEKVVLSTLSLHSLR